MRYVYLHGFASGPRSTKARLFRDHFAREGVDLLVPDLAEGDFEHLTVTRQLGVIERAAGKEPAVLIGSSLGGYLAALYAARHPCVARLLLLAPAFGFARRWPEALAPHLAAEWRRTGWLYVYHYGDGRIRRLSSAIFDDAAQYEDYPAITQPVLIFHGTRDTVVPAAVSEKFATRHPEGTLRLVDSGHELLDVAGRIWEESRDFLFAPTRPCAERTRPSP